MKKMKLSYRGVPYDYVSTTVSMTSGEVAGKYRGINWKFLRFENVAVPQPTIKSMKYRGVTYYTGLTAIQAQLGLSDRITSELASTQLNTEIAV